MNFALRLSEPRGPPTHTGGTPVPLSISPEAKCRWYKTTLGLFEIEIHDLLIRGNPCLPLCEEGAAGQRRNCRGSRQTAPAPTSGALLADLLLELAWNRNFRHPKVEPTSRFGISTRYPQPTTRDPPQRLRRHTRPGTKNLHFPPAPPPKNKKPDPFGPGFSKRLSTRHQASLATRRRTRQSTKAAPKAMSA